MIVGGVADRVDLLFRLSRTKSTAEVMTEIKKQSSAWVNQRKSTNAYFHWQSSYGAFSVSSTSLETVREYIRNQPKYHEMQSFQDEYREWLNRYGETWDERYLWDG
jgi:putative transposase